MQARVLLLLILLLQNPCFADAIFKQTLTTNVPQAVNVTAIDSAAAIGTINPQTGNSSSPSASFRLQTNGSDSNYTYVVQAKLVVAGGSVQNAYAQIGSLGYILLANSSLSNQPTLAAVNNIKSGSAVSQNNANVIAYPVINTLNNLSSITLTNNATYGGLCYIVQTGTSRNGTLKQAIGVSPLANTYSVANDRAGVYQATITFTANRNP